MQRIDPNTLVNQSRPQWLLELKMSGYRASVIAAVVAASSVTSSVRAQSAAKSADMSAVSSATSAAWRTFRKPPVAELKKTLTPLQYSVTQNADTEFPFRNTYWDNHAAGIYVDIVSGEPLFSSLDKYDSGTGWPSFSKPLVAVNLRTKNDASLGDDRTEVRSARANSHLGHVFDDGPKPTGLRYCMNSAAMRFIPVSKLVAEGYGEYAAMFSLVPK